MPIRADRVEGFRDLVVTIVKETLTDLGLIKSVDKPQPEPKNGKVKSVKKVAAMLLAAGLASLMVCGNSYALLRPRNMDEVTTEAWTFQSVVIPSSLTVTGSMTTSGTQVFSSDVDVNAGLDVDTPTTNLIGIQFTTLTAAAGGEIGITAGQDVDIDAVGDDVLINAADDIALDAVGVLDINCGIDADTSNADLDGIQFTTSSDASGAGEIGITAGEDVDIDGAVDIYITATAGDVDIDADGDDVLINAADDVVITGDATDSVVTLTTGATGTANIEGGSALNLDGTAIGVGDVGDTMTITAATIAAGVFTTQSDTNIDVLTASMPVLTDASKNLVSGAGYWTTFSATSGAVTANVATDSLSIVGAGINATSITADELTITGTEVDGSVTNELQSLFATFTSDEGQVTASTQTDALSVIGGGITLTSISGSVMTVTSTEVDGSVSNELQSLFATFTSDEGQVTASTQTDAFSIIGGGIATTAISGSEMTVTATEAQDLDAVCTLGADFAGIVSFSAVTGLDYIRLDEQTVDPAVSGGLWLGTDGVLWFQATDAPLQISP